MIDLSHIKAIAFDADDTLWVNEPLFREAEAQFCKLMTPFIAAQECNKILFDYEMKNLPLYGYGIKPFVLSLIECGMAISNNKLPNETVAQIIDIGKNMLNEPVQVLEGIEETLQKLAKNYRLVMATKGDLLDQERKLIKSGLEEYFHHIEIVSDKTPKHYLKLMKHLDVAPDEFLMIGNSVKSDILPVLEAGGYAVHVPFHTTWAHELATEPLEHPKFAAFESALALTSILSYS